MNKILLLALCTICSTLVYAQKDYKVVFDVTSRDSVDHKNVIRWVKEITEAEPTSQVEVVFYGKSLDMVTNGRSTVSNDLMNLAQKKNVSFRVCQQAMKNNGVANSDLIAGVGTVPDGIYEIITKQRQGWGYIKASK
jgi:uncharacterized protein